MAVRLFIVLFPILAAGLCLAGEGPFRLPPGARVKETLSPSGWQATGTLPLSYMQAQARLATALSAAGWRHRHTITLGRDRLLDAWQRGTEELTVMVWRIAPDRTGFSYGFGGGAPAGKDRNA